MIAGPHDWFRNATGSYVRTGPSHLIGNAKYFTGFRKVVDAIANYVLIIPSTPFAVAVIVEPYTHLAIYAEDRDEFYRY